MFFNGFPMEEPILIFFGVSYAVREASHARDHLVDQTKLIILVSVLGTIENRVWQYKRGRLSVFLLKLWNASFGWSSYLVVTFGLGEGSILGVSLGIDNGELVVLAPRLTYLVAEWGSCDVLPLTFRWWCQGEIWRHSPAVVFHFPHTHFYDLLQPAFPVVHFPVHLCSPAWSSHFSTSAGRGISWFTCALACFPPDLYALHLPALRLYAIAYVATCAYCLVHFPHF